MPHGRPSRPAGRRRNALPGRRSIPMMLITTPEGEAERRNALPGRRSIPIHDPVHAPWRQLECRNALPGRRSIPIEIPTIEDLPEPTS